MNLLLDIITILLCIVALWYGALWVVDAATRIARRTGLSDLVIGLTIVALGTSAPELAVTIGSALNGQADISVGNIVGSNVFNLGFILGGVALIQAIATSRPLIHRDGAALLGASLILLFFIRDLMLVRWEAAILFILLIAYIAFLFTRGADAVEEVPAGDFTPWSIAKLILGIAAVIGGGHFLVEAASDVARLAGLSEWVIGVTIVAAGTSAPEMATSFTAALRGQHGLSAGNLIGSDIFNILGVLGIAGLIRPLQVDHHAIEGIIMMGGMILLVIVLLRTRWTLSRREGALLVLVSIARWGVDLFGLPFIAW